MPVPYIVYRLIMRGLRALIERGGGTTGDPRHRVIAEPVGICGSSSDSKQSGRRKKRPRDGREEIVQPASSLLRDLVRKRDFYAGGLMLLLGLGIALKGSTYRAGSLMHMGPGFLPTALGELGGRGIAVNTVAPGVNAPRSRDPVSDQRQLADRIGGLLL